MNIHNDTTRKVRVPAASATQESRFRRWATRVGTGGAIFVITAFCQVYLVINNTDVFESTKWWAFGMYSLAGGIATAAITAKAYRDIALAKLGALIPGSK